MPNNAQRKYTDDWAAPAVNQGLKKQNDAVESRTARLNTTAAQDGFMRVAPLDEPVISASGKISPISSERDRFGTAVFNQHDSAETWKVTPPGTRTTVQNQASHSSSLGAREYSYQQSTKTGILPEETLRSLKELGVYSRSLEHSSSMTMGDHRTQTDLYSEKSTNIQNRNHSFWEKPVEETKTENIDHNLDQAKQEVAYRAIKKAFVALVGIIILVFISKFFIFVVRNVQIDGASPEQANEILSAAGIRRGESIFNIKEPTVALNLNASSQWTLKSVQIHLPDSIVVQVQERKVVAVLRHWGVQYFIDKKGMVMAQSENIDAQYVGLPEISGLKINRCSVGSFLNILDDRQWPILQSILIEMKTSPTLKMIANINLTDPNNILLTTTEGYSVRLGNKENLHAKLKAVVHVVNSISQDKTFGLGTLDVRTPEKPTFSPEKGNPVPTVDMQGTMKEKNHGMEINQRTDENFPTESDGTP